MSAESMSIHCALAADLRISICVFLPTGHSTCYQLWKTSQKGRALTMNSWRVLSLKQMQPITSLVALLDQDLKWQLASFARVQTEHTTRPLIGNGLLRFGI